LTRSRVLLVIALLIVLLAASGAFIAISLLSSPVSQTPERAEHPTVTKSTCDRPPGFILIIADLTGFNNSIGHGAPANPWPIIHVHRGDAVRLLVCNKDMTQPHGFAITTYFDAGVTMTPGDAYKLVFTATIPGTFVVYCNIFCTIHIYMVGRLIVSE